MWDDYPDLVSDVLVVVPLPTPPPVPHLRTLLTEGTRRTAVGHELEDRDRKGSHVGHH